MNYGDACMPLSEQLDNFLSGKTENSGSLHANDGMLEQILGGGQWLSGPDEEVGEIHRGLAKGVDLCFYNLSYNRDPKSAFLGMAASSPKLSSDHYSAVSRDSSGRTHSMDIMCQSVDIPFANLYEAVNIGRENPGDTILGKIEKAVRQAQADPDGVPCRVRMSSCVNGDRNAPEQFAAMLDIEIGVSGEMRETAAFGAVRKIASENPSRFQVTPDGNFRMRQVVDTQPMLPKPDDVALKVYDYCDRYFHHNEYSDKVKEDVKALHEQGASAKASGKPKRPAMRM